jgi:hypothetical protein
VDVEHAHPRRPCPPIQPPADGPVNQFQGRLRRNKRRKTTSGEWTDQPQYFDVAIWSGLGEWIAGHVTKGQKVVVAGRETEANKQ